MEYLVFSNDLHRNICVRAQHAAFHTICINMKVFFFFNQFETLLRNVINLCKKFCLIYHLMYKIATPYSLRLIYQKHVPGIHELTNGSITSKASITLLNCRGNADNFTDNLSAILQQ